MGLNWMMTRKRKRQEEGIEERSEMDRFGTNKLHFGHIRPDPLDRRQ